MSIDQEYKDFSKWCRDNPAYDLDPRLHTHSGRINDGGYILHKRTGTAFKAWQASRKALEGEPVGTARRCGYDRDITYCEFEADEVPIGTKLYTHPASAEVERLQAQVVELVAVAVSVRDDLLLRSEIDSDGTRCVNLSASKWSSFCDVIDETAKAEGADNAG